MDFDLHPSDITVPEVCPVLGIPIIVGAGKFNHNCPRDNVLVISCRANTIKCDATPEELKKVADFYTSHKTITERNPIVPIAPSNRKISEENKQLALLDFSQGISVKKIAHKYNISCRLAWEITHPEFAR